MLRDIRAFQRFPILVLYDTLPISMLEYSTTVLCICKCLQAWKWEMLDNLHYLAQLDFVVTTKSVACRVFRRRRMPPSKDRRLVGRGVGVGAFTPCVDILSLNFFGVGIGLGCGFGLGWGFGGESFNLNTMTRSLPLHPGVPIGFWGLGIGGGCGVGVGLAWGVGFGAGSKYINQYFLFRDVAAP
jgi:hypothetical protein